MSSTAPDFAAAPSGLRLLCTTMKAEDVSAMLDMALTASSCDCGRVVHKPRLPSDNGSSYISGDLAEWLQTQSMAHVRGAPNHSQTQGKIERWHQTLRPWSVRLVKRVGWKKAKVAIARSRRDPAQHLE